jgi:hypothetical protein
MKKALVLVAILGLTLTVACATSVNNQPPQNYFQRLFSGDYPKTPVEAQEWLDGMTDQVRQFSVPVRLYCALAYAETGEYPHACHEAEKYYQDLVKVRLVLQEAINLWAASGGAGSPQATQAFYSLLQKQIPDAAANLNNLERWSNASQKQVASIKGGKYETVPEAPGETLLVKPTK